MKKNVYILSLSFLIYLNSVFAEHCQPIPHELDNGIYYQESSLHATIQKYISSIVPGFVVGANTAIFCAFFDGLIPPLWPLFWFCSYSLRTKIVDDISHNYKEHHVRHDKMLMELCAFVTTWISYYKLYEAMYGKPPF